MHLAGELLSINRTVTEKRTMKISEVSDVDLSRWIAEKLEPKPDEHLCGGKYNPYAHRNVYECPACIFRGLQKRTFQFFTFSNDRFWQPRDMVHDPAMTVMLLEKMGRHTERPLTVSVTTITAYWQVDFGGAIAGNERLGRAVAEAFALANGWSGD